MLPLAAKNQIFKCEKSFHVRDYKYVNLSWHIGEGLSLFIDVVM